LETPLNRPTTFSQPLNQFNAEKFLRDYWQKKPVVLRNALVDFIDPISPEELAGLACEEGSEARMVIGDADGFLLEHGPFEENRFATLPEKDWSLLVQAVDHCVPAVAQLMEHFRFIPNWRIDDVMVSYAAKGGTVGKHFDNYDVFLIQGQGSRLWQVGQYCDQTVVMQPHDELSLLADFELQEQWQLNPGDILYIPPRVAHYGVATTDDCMTYSIGFRAPAHADIISHFCDHVLAGLNDQQRFIDDSLSPLNNPGEITPQAIEQIQSVLKEHFTNKESITQWFGEYVSELKYDDSQLPTNNYTIANLIDILERNTSIHRDASSRFVFAANDNGLSLFVNGQSYPCLPEQQALVELLAEHSTFSNKQLAEHTALQNNQALLCNLFNQGCLYINEHTQS
jgi:50S ribosomal protein L16 3-hydroxylase